jgi:hypothetical protein
MPHPDFSWLPPIFTLQSCSGDQLHFIEQASNIFQTEIVNGGLTLFGKPVYVFSETEADGKHKTFWHIITDPHNPVLTNVKYERAERLPWIKPIIENYLKDEVLIYERYKNGAKRVHLFVPDKQYMIVLEETKKCFYITTAFYIDYSYKVDDYKREYKKYGPKTKTAA